MADSLGVFVELDGAPVFAGKLFGHRRRQVESATFMYDAGFLADARAYALDPDLPLVSGALQTPVGLEVFGAFSDSAPDRWGRRLILRAERRRAELAGETPRSFGELDFLVGVRDDLRQGANRFASPTGAWLADDDTGVPYLVDLPLLLGASDAVERDDPDAAQLATLLRAGSSLGGARPKAHVLDHDGAISIAKFPRPVIDEWDVVRWEAVALELARRAGILAADSRLEAVDGRGVLLVRRFDRQARHRLAYASAMTLLGAADGEHRSYVEIAEVIEEESAAPTDDLRELWRRIVFGVLIRNTDDHLRNHGFVRRGGGGWRLSPAFDVNPNPEPGNTTLSTSIDGTSDEARLDLALEVAPVFRLSADAADRVVREVANAVAGWRDVASAQQCLPGEIDRMAPAFEHREADAARTRG